MFNDVPPIRFEDGPTSRQLLIKPENHGMYWVDDSDFGSIDSQVPCTYTLREEGREENECLMTIQQRDLVSSIRTVADHIENFRVEFNIQVALARRDQTSTSKKSFPEFERLKLLNSVYVKKSFIESRLRARSYGANGMRIIRRHAYSFVDQELRALDRAVQFAQGTADANTFGIAGFSLRQHLNRAIKSLTHAKATNPTLEPLEGNDDLPEEIIVKYISIDTDSEQNDSL